MWFDSFGWYENSKDADISKITKSLEKWDLKVLYTPRWDKSWYFTDWKHIIYSDSKKVLITPQKDLVKLSDFKVIWIERWEAKSETYYQWWLEVILSKWDYDRRWNKYN